MSEYAPNPEAHKPHEKLVDPEHRKRAEKVIHEQAEKARQERSAENLALLRELAKEQAESRHKIDIDPIKDREPDTLLGMQQSLKSNAYERSLKSVQQKLPKPVRLFSQLTHNKAVETISNTTAKTVARPSGLLGGSIVAFLGSLILLYYTKHYGFTYNYAFFIILFVAGFLVGALIELGFWAIYKSKHGRY